MKEKVGKQRGVQVFIPRESGGWGDARRLTRRVGAKPDEVALGLEAGKSGHFTATQIILLLIIYKYFIKSYLILGWPTVRDRFA